MVFLKEMMPMVRIYHARVVAVTNIGNNHCGIVSAAPSVDLAGQKTAGWKLFAAWAKTIPDRRVVLA